MGNWDRRDKLRAEAAAHEKYLHEHFEDLIEQSIRMSEVVSADDVKATLKASAGGRTHLTIKLVQSDTVKALWTSEFDHPAVLNFASFHNAGGKYIDGAMAQEEALCHHSNLYSVLSSAKFKNYYNSHRDKKINAGGLYSNDAILSKNIIFFDSAYKDIKDCVMITCAAPNKNAALKWSSIEENTNYNALIRRIEYVLAIADMTKTSDFIAGAFGCGVFGQSPQEVASIFISLLSQYNFKNIKHITFAIPPDENYKSFYHTFKWYCEEYNYEILHKDLRSLEFKI